MTDLTQFTRSTITGWERFYRANFINSLSGFKSLSLIGTCNAAQQTNLAIFSNVVHLGAHPPLIGYINRPLAAAHHTIENLTETGYYTLNQVTQDFYQQAHQTSAKYADGVSEFKAVGLTEQWRDFPAPYVQESVIQIGLKHMETLPIQINNTSLVIGEVQEVWLPQEIVTDDGFIQSDQAGSLTSLGIDGYYKTSPIARLAYAKPDLPPRTL